MHLLGPVRARLRWLRRWASPPGGHDEFARTRPPGTVTTAGPRGCLLGTSLPPTPS